MENQIIFYFILVLLINNILSLFFKPDKSQLYCGIFGFISKNKQNADLNKITIGMMYNDSRGGHASGIYNGKVYWKNLGESPNVMIDFETGKTVIGHTRFGTHGSNTVDNAHPYEYGNWVGVHNGVLSNHLDVCETYGLKDKDVDSKAIFQLINKVGVSNAIRQIAGSAALAIHNLAEDKVYLYRSDNPLFLGETEEGIYFSSMKEPLALIRATKIREIPEETVIVFKNGVEISRENKVKMKPEVYKGKQWYDYKNKDKGKKKLGNPYGLDGDLPGDDDFGGVHARDFVEPMGEMDTLFRPSMDGDEDGMTMEEIVEEKVYDYKETIDLVEGFLDENKDDLTHPEKSKLEDAVKIIQAKMYELYAFLK